MRWAGQCRAFSQEDAGCQKCALMSPGGAQFASAADRCHSSCFVPKSVDESFQGKTAVLRWHFSNQCKQRHSDELRRARAGEENKTSAAPTGKQKDGAEASEGARKAQPYNAHWTRQQSSLDMPRVQPFLQASTLSLSTLSLQSATSSLPLTLS